MANAAVAKARGEAEAIRATGEAKADAYRAGAEAMGTQGYTAVQLMQIVGESNVRIIPEIMVGGGGNGNSAGSGTMVDALLGVMLQQQMGQKKINVEAEKPSSDDDLPKMPSRPAK